MNSLKFKRFLILIIAVTFLSTCAWYVLKPYDYTVTFKTKANFGTINQTLKLWSNSILDSAYIVKQKSLNDVKQQIVSRGNSYIYHWQFVNINDSLTRVNIGINDENHSLKNRIDNLFSYTDFEKEVKTTITDFVTILKEHLDKFKVTIIGEVNIPEVYCAYVSVKSKQYNKAKGMMQNYGLLNSVLIQNHIVLNGRPIVDVTNWNMQNDSIHFDFCYPIIKQEKLPDFDIIKYKWIKSKKAIKAVYNGNYITSDRAWYALLEYAKKNKIKVSKTPLEVFYNNPNFGGDELRWKAEIYMPLNNN
ncbi:AraC family transcriptional regulator [Yeosuana marina]|uniref:AraC family transcriptional regulator n=1 Tax=Yeosuana marina TaxID=1565536 RepID=UPI001F0DDF82|nr:AraC family transcriptional regulator [Yeosuana marina]